MAGKMCEVAEFANLRLVPQRNVDPIGSEIQLAGSRAQLHDCVRLRWQLQLQNVSGQ